jgi:hypothetical protein
MTFTSNVPLACCMGVSFWMFSDVAGCVCAMTAGAMKSEVQMAAIAGTIRRVAAVRRLVMLEAPRQ